MGWRNGLAQFALALCALLWVDIASGEGLATQDAPQARSFRVLSVQVSDVQIDVGSDFGVRPGDRVLFEPLGQPDVEATVSAVQPRRATVSLRAPQSSIVPGVSGRVWPSASPVGSRQAPDPRDPQPDGPVWQDPDAGWQEDMPLLASAKGVKPRDRKARWSGRASLSARFFNDQTGTDRDDRTIWLRTALFGSNPFGAGGEMDLQFDLANQSLDVGSGAVGVLDTSEDQIRLLRASYAIGGDRHNRDRLQVGRFYPHLFPELGIFDGVEWTRRLASGTRFGARLGFLPGFDVDLPFKDDLTVAAYLDRPFGSGSRSHVGGAVESTWFDGKSDRNWLLLKAHYHEWTNWSFDVGLEGDLYGSEGGAKSNGFEWTQSRARVERSFGSGAALALFASDIRWPYTLRGLPLLSDPQFLVSAQSERLGLDGHIAIDDKRTISGKLEDWSDEDSDGSLGDLSIEARLAGPILSSAIAGAYWNDTDYAQVQAIRLGVRGESGIGLWGAQVEFGQFDILDTSGEFFAQSQTVLRGNLNRGLAKGWSTSANGAWYVGGDQDAYTLTLSLSRSF